MKKSIIVAQALNRTIGKQGQLPWRLPKDLIFFKQKTYGHPIIMGRRTFESIGRVLPGRHTILLTRNKAYDHPKGCTVAYNLADAFSIAQQKEAKEAFVIGGAQLYKEALQEVERLYVTQVHAHIDGDSFFPPIDGLLWKEIDRIKHPSDRNHAYAYDFCTYVRR